MMMKKKKMVMMIMIILMGIVGDPQSCGLMVQQQQLIAACNNTSSSEELAESMRCTNLGNNIRIPSPFVTEELKECVPGSADFVLANCSPTTGHQPFWKTFTKALPVQDVQQGLIGPPTVVGLIADAPHDDPIHVNITWDSSSTRTFSAPAPPASACRRPRSSSALSHYFPTYINLSQLHTANTKVKLSRNTVFLLLNCSHDMNRTSLQRIQPELVNSSSLCQMYKTTCTPNLTATFGAAPNCHQLDWVDDTDLGIRLGLTELPLQSILDSMSCTHFEVFVVTSSGGSSHIAEVGQWHPGVMQLLLMNFECKLCQQYSGECVYGASNGSYLGCNCTKDGQYRVFVDTASCNSWVTGCWEVGRISICKEALQSAVIWGGIGIGCLLFLIGLCCCAYRCGTISMRNRRLKRRALWERQHSLAYNDGSIARELIDLVGLSERPLEYSYKSIESATRSFNSLVGKGGFGVVFKGELPASRNSMHNQEQYSFASKEIAVKVLDVRSNHSKKQFVNEVAIIGRVHHINVVRLLGFCMHDEHQMLVYEYVTNGSLDRWLFEPKEEDMAVVALDWRQRYSIAVGIARGLSYLHEECRHRIVHCDVKPQNILLDGQMCPKIADFGLARLINRGESRVVTFAKGTPGYMAPELWVGGDIQLSTKADVYSFGMVLLELISGRKNFAHGLPHFPAVAFDTAVNKNEFDSLLDVRLTRSVESEEQQQQTRTAVLVALWCIQDNPASRPCMSLVVQLLEGVAAVSERPPYPTIASASEGSCTFQQRQQHMMISSAFSYSDVTPR